jgi:hypothetical protein
MKSTKQIEQSIRELSIEADAETQERILRDIAQTHAQQKRKTQAFGLLHYGRIIMKQKPKRIAAGIAAALLLAGLLGLGSGSVAFSQARHTLNSTLSWLKDMITGDTDTANMPPALEATPDPNGRTILCTASFFPVPPDKQPIWQSLEDSGIEFVRASAAPEVYFAALSRRQAESLGALQSLECMASPRILMREGQTAAIATANQEEARGLAIGWLSTVSDDGTEIRSTVSFHDGRDGFEISSIPMEPGGVALIRAKGMWSYCDDPDRQNEYFQEMLIRVQVDLEQTP